MPRLPRGAPKRSAQLNLSLYHSEMSAYEEARRAYGFRTVADFVRHAAWAASQALKKATSLPSLTPQERVAIGMALRLHLDPTPPRKTLSSGGDSLTLRGREMLGLPDGTDE